MATDWNNILKHYWPQWPQIYGTTQEEPPETSANWRTVRDAGIDRATRGAPPEWTAEAHRALDQVCHDRNYFTAWNVYEAMDPALRDLAKGQSMGGVFRRAQHLSKCVPTKGFRCERQARNHGRPQRVWESYLYLDTEEGAP